MNNSVSEQMVDYYILGLLSDAAREQVERAYDDHLEVKWWFTQRDTAPDHVRYDQELEDAQVSYDQWLHSPEHDPNKASYLQLIADLAEAKQRARSGLSIFAEMIREAGAEVTPFQLMLTPKPTLLGDGQDRLDFSAFGGGSEMCEMGYALSGSPAEATPPAGTLPGDAPVFGRDGDYVFVNCPFEELPSGLCWIRIVNKDNETDRVLLPRFEQWNGRWQYSIHLTDLFGHLVQRTEIDFLPANADTYGAFDIATVRNFVEQLAREDAQRIAAMKFLGEVQNDEL